MTASRHYDVIVVGAGLAGLATTLRLRDTGISVAVIDSVARLEGDRMNWGHDLQPNAIAALDELGLLAEVERLGARHDRYHLEKLGGGRLSTWEYAMLDHTYPYAVCIRTHALRELMRARADSCDHVDMYIPARFTKLAHGTERHTVTLEQGDCRQVQLSARLVVGADGPRSRLRDAAGIKATFRRGRYHWLDVIMRDKHGDVDQGYVYFGRGEYLGMVPTRTGELVAFHLTDAESAEAYRARFGNSAAVLGWEYSRMAPILDRASASVESWEQTSFTPGHSMRAQRWVDDGIALVGDSAVSVNPITSSGAALAIQGGVKLAEVAARCLQSSDLSRAALAGYERECRAPAERMQEMGDLLTWAFSNRNLVVSALQQRVLSGFDKRPHMKHRVLAYFAGVHPERVGVRDGLAAAGLWGSRRRGLAVGKPIASRTRAG